MDRMNKQFYSGLFAALTVFSLMFPQFIRADEGDVPEYSASPSATQKPSLSTTQLTRCAVKVTNGVKASGPVEVTFLMRGTVGGKEISEYVYEFGDGETATGKAEVTHRYAKSGNYSIIVTPVIDPSLDGLACKTAVTIKTAKAEPIKAECKSLDLLTGDTWSTETVSKMRISSTGNSNELLGYKLDVSGQVWEQSGNEFEIQMASVGAYLAKAYVKDSEGNWSGGEKDCVRQINVTKTGLTTQPETGPGNQYWLSLGSLSILWVGVMVWRRYQHLQIG